MENPTSPETPTLELQVTAAFPRHVGRGLARLGTTAFEKLGLAEGDRIEIRGKRATACRASFNEDEPGVQVDELARRNAGVDVAETVQVRRIEVDDAERVVLEPLDPHDPAPDTDEGLLNQLEDLTVVAGDHVRVTLADLSLVDLAVQDASPPGAVRIAGTTRILLAAPRHDRSPAVVRKVTFDDIGGLGTQLQRVREIIELPLLFPEVFAHLGIEAPSGVLLHGPPGCGKTLTARAAAQEIEATFFSISGPEIVHKFYGESEAHLRTLFEQATASRPSILFLDEIDAIAPSRDKVQGEVEKRVVAQLLALMDGIARRSQVIVIAATNRPNALDPALRRPGRFDREIMIPVPDPAGRLEILQIHARAMPLADDVDLEQLARATHGYVGADLEALCREAAMSRLRRIMPEIDFALDEVPRSQLASVEVTMEDFLAAFHEVQPSALREVSIEVPTVRWDEIGGLDDVKARLRAVFDWPLHHPELFERAAVRPTRGILLQGPPGCGKTLLAQAMASESGVNFIAIKGPELLSQFVGESEERLRDLFRKARRASPCILFFDEIDALFPTRSEGAGDSRTSERMLSQFLAELDGIEELKDVLVLGATNRLDLLDPALLRPDRFDEVLEVPLPETATRRRIFEVHLRGKPLAVAPDLDELAASTEGLSGAEIAEAVRRAALRAIARVLEGAGEEKPDPASLRIEAADVEEALAALRPGVG